MSMSRSWSRSGSRRAAEHSRVGDQESRRRGAGEHEQKQTRSRNSSRSKSRSRSIPGHPLGGRVFRFRSQLGGAGEVREERGRCVAISRCGLARLLRFPAIH
jgi:hypothetical protein